MTEETAIAPTILIVEDVAMVRNTLKLILKSGGYRVLEAPSPKEAIPLLSKGKEIGLIMADVMMPGMNGLEFCKVVKSQEATKDIPVIMCTARNDPATVAEAVKNGARDFVLKPFTRDVVLKKVGGVLPIPTPEDIMKEEEEKDPDGAST